MQFSAADDDSVPAVTEQRRHKSGGGEQPARVTALADKRLELGAHECPRIRATREQVQRQFAGGPRLRGGWRGPTRRHPFAAGCAVNTRDPWVWRTPGGVRRRPNAAAILTERASSAIADAGRVNDCETTCFNNLL